MGKTPPWLVTAQPKIWTLFTPPHPLNLEVSYINVSDTSTAPGEGAWCTAYLQFSPAGLLQAGTILQRSFWEHGEITVAACQMNSLLIIQLAKEHFVSPRFPNSQINPEEELGDICGKYGDKKQDLFEQGRP